MITHVLVNLVGQEKIVILTKMIVPLTHAKMENVLMKSMIILVNVTKVGLEKIVISILMIVHLIHV